jgi:hypothetical protein
MKPFPLNFGHGVSLAAIQIKEVRVDKQAIMREYREKV